MARSNVAYPIHLGEETGIRPHPDQGGVHSLIRVCSVKSQLLSTSLKAHKRHHEKDQLLLVAPRKHDRDENGQALSRFYNSIELESAGFLSLVFPQGVAANFCS